MVDNVTLENMKPRITVIGIGGAGGNAVNNMIRSKLEGVEFIVANTDAQALTESSAELRIQLGLEKTKGLGAGSKPEIGRASAEETFEEIQNFLRGSHMLFLTAGMGGGTGTGAAPVIAKIAREMGILTVGVVTKPFHFEGIHRMRTAEQGIEELQHFVDTLIVIPNQNLFRLATDRTTFADAFHMADNVLYSGVRGVTDLMIMPGLINLDFADVRTVMGEMGKAMMGTGEAGGENRAIQAAEAAISNPLLDDVSMRGARGVLINITGGLDMTLFEVDEAANRIREEVDPNANIIFGSTFDERMSGSIRVSVVATGIEKNEHSKTVQITVDEFVAPLEKEPELDLMADVSEEENGEEDQQFEDQALDEEALFSKDTLQEEQNSLYQEEKQEEEKMSFFQRLGFGRKKEEKKEIPSKDKGVSVRSSQESKPMVRTRSMDMENLENSEDLLEIPAFLRKKK
jgi:cell division protein FtsZ